MDRSLREFLVDPEHTLVVADFDGTLATIVDDPAAAQPVVHAGRDLAVLAEQVQRVAIVSGRPVSFLRRAFPADDALALYGLYGMEREADGRIVLDPRVAEFVTPIADAYAIVGEVLPEVRTELKSGVVLTLHWRERPEVDGEATALSRRIARDFGLEFHPGRMSVELRPPVAITKATTVTELAADARRVLIAGDDRADLEAFIALDALVADGALDAVYKVAVHSAEAPLALFDRASLVVHDPHEVVAMLGRAATIVMTRDGHSR